MEVKAILFDAAGTLFTSTRPVAESYKLLAMKYGMKVSTLEIQNRFKNCFDSAKPLAFLGASKNQIKQLERVWWKNLVQSIFEPYGPFLNFDDYFSELFEYFSRAESWVLFDDTKDTLSALRAKGITLAVVSNFDSRLFGILEGLGIASQFESILISSEVGFAKPAIEIFQQALKVNKVTQDETLFIGDSPQTDMLGATRAGLRSVLLNPKINNSEHSCYQISKLKELLDIVDING